MKIKTSELTREALNVAVAKCKGGEFHMRTYRGDSPGNPFPAIQWDCDWQELSAYSPSTDWSQGGPIIERELIEVGRQHGEWIACINAPENGDWESTGQYGPTPLIAAMRCYVASKLGDEVELPEELK